MTAAGFLAAEEAPESVYLHPGQVYTAGHAALVSTILGSCVAVCLWDPLVRVAGINHYLLPNLPLSSNRDVSIRGAPAAS